jgi:ATP-dependent Lon protease
MKGLLEKYMEACEQTAAAGAFVEKTDLQHQVAAMNRILCDLFGTDRLVFKASKLEALHLIRSEILAEQVLGLEKIVYEDPTLDAMRKEEEIPAILAALQEELAGILARRAVEEKLEKKIAEKIQERQDEFLREIKKQILREQTGPENAQTLKKLALLEKIDQAKLACSALEILRPSSLKEIVGQARGIKSLVAKLASPFPQHVLLYGPPGVGKTTAARLALDSAKSSGHSPFSADAPFIEVNGATLRWDPREITNPLLGSVHDPIYQGAKRDLADTGIPEPKLGLVTDAHGGVLFIDEIGEMDSLLLTKLLKVLEDKRVEFDSSYYDPHDPNVPQYIRKIFTDGAPADFVLIGATTRDPSELNPALRSRCAEVYFEPLNPSDIQEILRQAAIKLKAELDAEVPEIISDYTIEGRKANSILADAYGLALLRKTAWTKRRQRKLKITAADVYEVLQSARMAPNVTAKAKADYEVGHIFGLGVVGFVGSILEIEAVAFSAREPGKGSLRFNETAGTMARDSVFNAASVFRKLTGDDLDNYDLHINVVGGGHIDGPSAGAAIMLALMSAVQNKGLRQDVAVTGELSLQGRIKPVGGIIEKIYGAKQSGVKTVLIPNDNQPDVPANLKGIKVVPVATIEEALSHVF